MTIKVFLTNGSDFTICEACVTKGKRESTVSLLAEGEPFLCDFCEQLNVVFEGTQPEKKLDSAGWDLRAQDDASIPVGKVQIIGTGLRLAMPKGWEAQIRARSSYGAKGVIVANGPGTIDHNYRDEVGVILLNLSGSVFEIKHGDRIAQMLFAPVPDVVWSRGSLNETDRKGGFGSTGVQ